MKILYTITKTNWGGAQKHVYDLIKGEKERGSEIIFCGGWDEKNHLLFDKIQDLGISCYKIESLGKSVSLIKDLQVFLSLTRIYKKEKPNIIHLHSSKIGGVGALAARLFTKAKVVYTAHSIPFEEKRNFISLFIIYLVTYLTIGLSHKTILISEGMKKAFPKKGVSHKYSLIYHGIDEPLFLTKEDARKKLSAEGGLTILTIAELTANKNVLAGIYAIEKLLPLYPTLEYHILGGGELYGNYEKYIQEKKLEKNIFLHGFVANAATYLPAGDIFLLPSSNEGFGYVLLEASLAELPLIGTDVGGIPDIIKNEVNGLLAPKEDVEKIKEALLLLLSDETKRKKYGKAAKDLSLKNFSLSRMQSETHALYEEVLEK
jgi:glycosyltransferase involved in cell wall biosynthesis